jgi:hypothetical protein
MIVIPRGAVPELVEGRTFSEIFIVPASLSLSAVAEHRRIEGPITPKQTHFLTFFNNLL